MILIAIDPGVQNCGVAWFEDRQLVDSQYVSHRALYHRSLHEELIIEMPRIYPGSAQQKGDLNDLLDLAAVVGFLECWCLDSKRVSPSQWKGQVPKKIMNARVLSKLSPEELTRIQNVGYRTHNVLDAVGIGLHHLGRL